MGILKTIIRELNKHITYGVASRLRHASNFLGGKYHIVDISGAGTVHVRPHTTDILSFYQVFHEKEYDFSEYRQFPRILAAYQRIFDSGRIPFIVDAGANVGAASIWFSKQFPEARILAIEPNGENAELCRLNTRDLPNIKVIEAAIGSEPGTVSLSNPAKQAWAFRTTRTTDGEIAVRTIPHLILDEQRAASLFLAKIDIEGFEEDLFANNNEWLDEVEVIIIELHDYIFAGQGRSQNFQREMGKRNFEILVSEGTLIYVRLPQASLE
jgi:FkbM family methyltransferase